MKRIALAAALCAAMASPALSQDIVSYGSVGNWDVLIDRSLDYGCFIQSEFDDGSLVRIGIDKQAGSGYLTVLNKAWGDIETGKEYDIVLDVDGERYNGVAEGIMIADEPGADIVFDSEDFFMAVMKKHALAIYNESGRVAAFSLKGTAAGLQAVLKCQEEVDASR